MQRRLYRTVELAGLPGWESLRQGGWSAPRIAPTTAPEQHEDRYFISNVPVGRLSPSQILGVVRGALGIENDRSGRWTWCSARTTRRCAQGSATLTLGFLRLLAYNLLPGRRKHLRPPAPSPAEAARSGPGARSLRAFEQALTRVPRKKLGSRR